MKDAKKFRRTVLGTLSFLSEPNIDPKNRDCQSTRVSEVFLPWLLFEACQKPDRKGGYALADARLLHRFMLSAFCLLPTDFLLFRS